MKQKQSVMLWKKRVIGLYSVLLGFVGFKVKQNSFSLLFNELEHKKIPWYSNSLKLSHQSTIEIPSHYTNPMHQHTLKRKKYFKGPSITQPDGTLFFLISTYLRGRSHWNSRDYASICHYHKTETNKGLYFELVKKKL